MWKWQLNKILKRNFEKTEMTDFQPKPQTLKELLVEWYETANFVQSKDVIANEIVNIVAEWLPKEHDTNSYKWNQCLKLIREKLR